MVRLYLSTPTVLGVSHPNTWHPALDPLMCLSRDISKHLAMPAAILEFKANSFVHVMKQHYRKTIACTKYFGGNLWDFQEWF